MKISPYAAHTIRDGIIEAKLDLEAGGDCHDHEPSLLAAAGMMFGSVLAYSPLEERAYLRTLDHAGVQTQPLSKAAFKPA